MKTKPLTQIELATLAAHLPAGSPEDRVCTAHAIWYAAGKRLDGLAAMAEGIADHRQKYEAEQSRIMGEIKFPPGTVSLEVFLAKTVPDKFHKSQRKDIFREFLAVPNPAMPGGIDELPVIESQGIGSSFVYGFAMAFRGWLESRDTEKAKSFHKERSESASLGRWGEKWVKDALAESHGQTLEMLVENTKRHTGKDRELAQKRVQDLITEGLLVKVDGKLYGTPKVKKRSL